MQCFPRMLTDDRRLQRDLMNFQLQNFQLYNLKLLKDWSLRKQ